MTARPPVLAVLAAVALTGCASNAAPDPDLSPLANEGRALYASRTCASCHGRSGEGAIGPPVAGLFGRAVDVEVSGDTITITADEAYLRESIVDPDAKRVVGSNSRMPAASLTDEEVDALIAYLVELAG